MLVKHDCVRLFRRQGLSVEQARPAPPERTTNAGCMVGRCNRSAGKRAYVLISSPRCCRSLRAGPTTAAPTTAVRARDGPCRSEMFRRDTSAGLGLTEVSAGGVGRAAPAPRATVCSARPGSPSALRDRGEAQHADRDVPAASAVVMPALIPVRRATGSVAYRPSHARLHHHGHALRGGEGDGAVRATTVCQRRVPCAIRQHLPSVRAAHLADVPYALASTAVGRTSRPRSRRSH